MKKLYTWQAFGEVNQPWSNSPHKAPDQHIEIKFVIGNVFFFLADLSDNNILDEALVLN